MDNKAQKPRIFSETILAIMIAVVTVLSALVSRQAAFFGHTRVEEDLDGLLASVNMQETHIMAQITAYDDLASYTRWWQYTQLAESVVQDIEASDDSQEDALLGAELHHYAQLALDSKVLFPNRYLTDGAGYNLDLQLGEMWADAAEERDLDPAPHFEESDNLIRRTMYMLAAGAILSIGLIFYALVESLEMASSRSRCLLILGSLLSVIGVIVAILTQFDLV